MVRNFCLGKKIDNFILKRALPFILSAPLLITSGCSSNMVEEDSYEVYEVQDASVALPMPNPVPEIMVGDEPLAPLSIVGEIPSYYNFQLRNYYSDDYKLDQITELKIAVNNFEDLSWIKYCSNLRRLEINFLEDVDQDKLDVLGELKELVYFKASSLSYLFFETDQEYNEALDNYNHDTRFKKVVYTKGTSLGYDMEVVNDFNINSRNFNFLSKLPLLEEIELENVSYNKDTDLEWIRDLKSVSMISLNLIYDDNYDMNFLIPILSSLDNLVYFSMGSNLEYMSLKDIEFINRVTSVMPSLDFVFKGFNALRYQYFRSGDEYVLRVGKDDNIEFQNFSKLDIVDFGIVGIYQAAIHVSTHDLEYFDNNGIRILVNESNGSVDDLRNLIQEIDRIAESLGIDPMASDQDKLNVVLRYIIESYVYDPNFLDNEAYDYYRGGYLYAAVNNDGKIICGNYAAMLSALLDRVGVPSYCVVSSNHAWNLVGVNDNYYYVDSCWIDCEDITFDGTNNLEYKWYMEDPQRVYEEDKMDAHKAISYPHWIDIDTDYTLVRKK